MSGKTGLPVPWSDVATLLDAGLTATVDSRALDGVPIVGSIAAACRLYGDLAARLYTRQVQRLLAEISICTDAEREAFARKLDETGQHERFGETILLLLANADAPEKPTIIGRVMAAHLRGKLQYGFAMRLCAIVNRCYIQDLPHLIALREDKEASDVPELKPVWESLAAAGLLSWASGFGGGMVYRLNRYGIALKEYGLPLSADIGTAN